MGESSSVGAGALSGHRLISPRRNLWPGVPDSPGRSIDPSNIAEGCGRDGDPELSRFCIIARGSASELEVSTPTGSRSETEPAQRLRTTVSTDHRNQTHAHRVGAE